MGPEKSAICFFYSKILAPAHKQCMQLAPVLLTIVGACGLRVGAIVPLPPAHQVDAPALLEFTPGAPNHTRRG